MVPRLYIMTFVALLLLGSANAKAQPPLEQARQKYRTDLRRLSVEATAMETERGERYIKTLERLEEQIKASGNLELVQAVRNEREYFQQHLEVPDQPVPANQAALARVRNNYRAQRIKLDNSKTSRILHLVRQYDQALQRLQRRLTAEGNIAEAVTVRDERATLEWQRPPTPVGNGQDGEQD